MSKIALIIDDDANDRIYIRRALEAHSFKVIEAENGEDGVQMVREHKPDIALIDTNMMTIDGFETCRRIKKLEDLNTKVIVMTGQVDAVDALKARISGADDYCVKTTDCNIVIEAVTAL